MYVYHVLAEPRGTSEGGSALGASPIKSIIIIIIINSRSSSSSSRSSSSGSSSIYTTNTNMNTSTIINNDTGNSCLPVLDDVHVRPVGDARRGGAAAQRLVDNFG